MNILNEHDQQKLLQELEAERDMELNLPPEPTQSPVSLEKYHWVQCVYCGEMLERKTQGRASCINCKMKRNREYNKNKYYVDKYSLTNNITRV